MTTSHLQRLAGIKDEFILEVAARKVGTSAQDELFSDPVAASSKMEVLPSWLIMPQQTRKGYAVEPLAELADTIEELGQINPISVGLFTDIDCLKEYVTELNDRFDCDLRIGEAPLLPVMHNKLGEVYFVAIAGYRRTLGNLANNASQSMKNGGQLDFDRNCIEVRAWHNPSFLLAMKLQVAENAGREDVQPWEEAESVAFLFNNEPHGQSREAFAKSLGMSAAALRGHIRYMDLPKQIRRLVDGSDGWLVAEAKRQNVDEITPLPYEIAVKLWPLQESRLFETDEIVTMAADFLRKNLTKKEMDFAINEAHSFRRLPISSQIKLVDLQINTSYWPEFARYYNDFADESEVNSLIDKCDMEKWTITHLVSEVKKKINMKKTYGSDNSFDSFSLEFAKTASAAPNLVTHEKSRILAITQELLRLTMTIKNGGLGAAAVVEGIDRNAADFQTVIDVLGGIGSESLGNEDSSKLNGLALGISELLAFVSRERNAAKAILEQTVLAEALSPDNSMASLFG